MLPTLFLQPTDFANFDIELSSPNLLPQDATEPEIAFAELLSLGAGVVLEPAPIAGQLLPEGGNPLPAVNAGHAPGGEALTGADGHLEGSVIPAVPLPQPAILKPASRPGAPAPTTVAPESRPVAAATVLNVETLSPAPATHTPDRSPALVPAAVAKALESPTASNAPPDSARQSAPATPRSNAQPLLATLKEPTLPVMPVTNAQPAAEIAGSARIQPPARIPLERPTTTLPAAAARATPDLNPVETGRELRAPMPPTGPATTTVQATPVPVGEASALNVPQTGPAPGGQSPVPTPGGTVSPDFALAARIDVPVKDAAWGEQLGQRLQFMANNQLQTAEIRVTPAELGPVRVQIAVDDGATNVTFQAQHAVTREAIEQALPRLREMLAENGLTLSQTNVGEQGVHHGSRDGAEEAAAVSYPAGDGGVEQIEDESGGRGERAAEGLVDTFA